MEGDEIFKLTSKDGDIAIEKEKVPVAAPAEFVPDMIFEQEPSQLLNAILPLYLNGQLLRTMQESVASELANRMSRTVGTTRIKRDPVELLWIRYPAPHPKASKLLSVNLLDTALNGQTD